MVSFALTSRNHNYVFILKTSCNCYPEDFGEGGDFYTDATGMNVLSEEGEENLHRFDAMLSNGSGGLYNVEFCHKTVRCNRPYCDRQP